ncbi:MAG TPA: PQQ-binding-like beta-propeller repeat protein [Methylomirabilota bacterium]|nr:PQQ-binding-like beta-propeller repeat protein [Methylomirabilota bacterium]
MKSAVFFLCAWTLLHVESVASDWPQLLGPTSDAVYAGLPIAETWTDQTPIVWQKDVGEGYSSPVVSQGRVVFCHRLGTNLIVECRDATNGKSFWNFKHSMKFQDGASFDSGPRATPAIKDGKVYVHNTDGYFVSLDLATGKKNWSHHTRNTFKTSATWHGSVSSPLVTESAVILLVGGTNSSGIVAFNKDDGKVIWKVTGDKASASSPVLATCGGILQVLVVTRSALHSLDPETGKDFWQWPTRRQTSGNVYAASPVPFGDSIFLSGWYQLDADLLRVKDGQPQVVWHKTDAVSTHYANAIVHKDHIYGFHGHASESGGPTLRCVEMATGKVTWKQSQKGSGTIIRCGENLLILFDSGELQLVEADPRRFKVKTRKQVVGRPTRSYPAIADGFVYVKGPKKLVCVDLRAERP